MRKIFALACAACATLTVGALTACGDKETKDPVYYTVTFVQSGQENVVKTVSEGKALTDIPETKAREGYTVTWESVDLSKITSNVTVKAVETPNTYTVTYTLDGSATIEARTQTATYDEAFAPYEPTLENYDFVCWEYENGESQTVGFASGTVWKFAKDMTFTAKWTPKQPVTYTITFVQTGFENVTRTVEAGGTLAVTDIPAPQPKTGYDVVWSVTEFSDVSGNMTVNAVETAKEFTLTYELGNATGAKIDQSTQKVAYGETYNLLTPTAPKKYTFVGWYIKGTDTKFENGTWNGTKDLTLVARWTVDEEESWTGFY